MNFCSFCLNCDDHFGILISIAAKFTFKWWLLKWRRWWSKRIISSNQSMSELCSIFSTITIIVWMLHKWRTWCGRLSVLVEWIKSRTPWECCTQNMNSHLSHIVWMCSVSTNFILWIRFRQVVKSIWLHPVNHCDNYYYSPLQPELPPYIYQNRMMSALGALFVQKYNINYKCWIKWCTPLCLEREHREKRNEMTTLLFERANKVSV